MNLPTPDQVQHLIATRRAVYPPSYLTDQPISHEIICHLLDCAHWAPSHRLTLPWRFKVITGHTRAVFGEALVAAYESVTLTENTSDEKRNKMRKNANLSAAIIAVCMLPDPQKRIPEWEEIAATACAVQNIWLAAHSYGIGAYWGTPAHSNAPPMRHFLQLPETEICLGFLYMGYCAQLPPPTTRPPQLITWL